jgi:hypothetical protein
VRRPLPAALFCVLLVFAGFGALTATAAPRAAHRNEAVHGKIVMPTRDGSPPTPTRGDVSAASGSSVEFNGGVDGIGVTTGTPQVYVVFWGSQWGAPTTAGDGVVSFASDTVGVAPRLQHFLAGLGTNNELWSGVLSQYCEGVPAGTTTCPLSAPHVGVPSGNALVGVWADNSVAAPIQATDNQLAAVAIAAAAHFGNATAASNRNTQYVVVSPHGTHPDGFGTASGQFCAWHAATQSQFGDLAFTNLPYVTDAGASCGQNYVNGGSAGTLDGVSIVGGHEYAETITDQLPPGGWTDPSSLEVADKCAWIGVGGTGGAVNLALATGSFAVAGLWSNDDNSCADAHPIVHTTPSDVVTASGSAMTEHTMDAVLASDGGGAAYDLHAGDDQSAPLAVPADAHCDAHTYRRASSTSWPAASAPAQDPGQLPAPRNTAEGTTALTASLAGTAPFSVGTAEAAPNGCIDVVRSSTPRTASEPSTTEHYAFAVDAVTWGSSSLNAPNALSQAQVQLIYQCAITDWSQVGGASGPIQRVLPEPGSDTATTFLEQVLGVSSSSDLPASGPGCPPIVVVGHDQFYDMLHGSSVYGPLGAAQQYPNAIAPYAASAWVFQAAHDTNPTVDLRSGFRPGALVVARAATTSAVNSVAWNGASWQLDTGTVVGDATSVVRAASITSTAASDIVTAASSSHAVTATTAVGSFLLDTPSPPFTSDDVGATVTAGSLPAGTRLTSVTSSGQAVVDHAASATGTGTVTVTVALRSRDEGAALSGNASFPAGTTITELLDSTTARVSNAATGSGVANTTLTRGPAARDVTVSIAGAGATQLTATGNTFTSADVGAVVESPCTFSGTTITAVDVGGDTATIAPPTRPGCAGSITARLGHAVVSLDTALSALGPSSRWPGVRALSNVVDARSPDYAAAVGMVGYDTTTGSRSPLCSGAHDADHGGVDSAIADSGLVPLPPDPLTGLTCRRL